jgi:hypothetical protein
MVQLCNYACLSPPLPGLHASMSWSSGITWSPSHHVKANWAHWKNHKSQKCELQSGETP